nr:MAG TPA: hypothetical protein [Bacteriophage sp.]
MVCYPSNVLRGSLKPDNSTFSDGTTGGCLVLRFGLRYQL